MRSPVPQGAEGAAPVRELAQTRSRVREVVFRFLCAGEVSAAAEVAGTLARTLPDPVRVCVVEGLPQRLRSPAGDQVEILGDRIWAFRATLQHDLFVLLAPGGEPELQALVQRFTTVHGCRVGMSATTALKDTAIAYEQALHALERARSATAFREDFTSRSRLALLLVPQASAWAQELLRPLLEYTPPRRTAPDSRVLQHTLLAWLTLSRQAPRHLNIHRNTLGERLRLIGSLLRVDLSRIADQSVVSLALRVHRQGMAATGRDGEGPVPLGGAGLTAEPEQPASLERLVDSPVAVAWAHRQLAPLFAGLSDVGESTVRCWLEHDARLAETALALGISVTATRKRLLRVSKDLGRSLLDLSGARHDLWLALLVHDRQTWLGNGCQGPEPAVPRLTRACTTRRSPDSHLPGC